MEWEATAISICKSQMWPSVSAILCWDRAQCSQLWRIHSPPFNYLGNRTTYSTEYRTQHLCLVPINSFVRDIFRSDSRVASCAEPLSDFDINGNGLQNCTETFRCVGFEVPTIVTVKVSFICVVTPCSSDRAPPRQLILLASCLAHMMEKRYAPSKRQVLSEVQAQGVTTLVTAIFLSSRPI
jgi:hypothetical protein